MHTLDHAHPLAGLLKIERKTVTKLEAQKPAAGSFFADHPRADLARLTGEYPPIRPAFG
ncbi:hypothetical protein [Xanthomonas axonopodis]|nr:hypothetical protein XAB3213_4680003 [Xanthomonas citri pv. bilvae]